MRPARSFWLSITLAALSVPALAAEWVDISTVSSTMGINSNRICIGDGSTADIGCPTYAPTVNSSGLLTGSTAAFGGLTVTGASNLANVSATTLEVTDDAAIAGNVTVDGTAAIGGLGVGDMAANNVSVTTNLFANNISATTLYVGSVAITGAGASGWYDLSDIPTGVAAISSTALATAELQQLQNIDSALIGANQWTRLQHLNQSVSTTSAVTFATASLGGLTVTGDSNLANVSATTLEVTDDAAIAGNITVAGTATIGGMGVGDMAANNVSVTNNLFVKNVSATTLYVGGVAITGSASGDRITSGTTSLIAHTATDYISITQAGTNTGWFDPIRGLITLGVSSTGPISATAFVGGSMKLATNSDEPIACNAATDATIAMTGFYSLCVCKNGTGWLRSSDLTTACEWSSVNTTWSTPGTYSYTPPPGMTNFTITVTGANGPAGPSSGGAGGRVTFNYSSSSGEPFHILVGAHNTSNSGASAIKHGSNLLAISGAGGGGGGASPSGAGGAGGGGNNAGSSGGGGCGGDGGNNNSGGAGNASNIAGGAGGSSGANGANCGDGTAASTMYLNASSFTVSGGGCGRWGGMGGGGYGGGGGGSFNGTYCGGGGGGGYLNTGVTTGATASTHSASGANGAVTIVGTP